MFDLDLLAQIRVDDGDPYVFPGACAVEILTRAEWGTVKVVLERHESAPALRLEGWDGVCEVSVLASPRADRAPESREQILISASGESEDVADFGPLECLGGVDTWWRLRVHRRGRPAGDEEHLIQAWPEQEGPAVVLEGPWQRG
ncbi:hypothetical protein AB0D11_43590 [Streptomyces monashensis]|uniref:hypothetical protein n=1 Tax=Streptomyces monashensis TaxID=1678012 RepID=UPI0033DB4751